MLLLPQTARNDGFRTAPPTLPMALPNSHNPAMRGPLTVVALALAATAKQFNVLDFGAKADNSTINTQAIAAAVTAAIHAGGSNEILFPSPGIYVTGSVNFTSSLTVTIEDGATVAGTTDTESYPVIAPLPSYGISRDINSCCRYAAIISCFNCSDFRLTGNGILDGRGQTWWNRFRDGDLKYSRPHLFEVYGSRNIFVGGAGSGFLTFRNSPFWTTHLYASQGIHIRQLNISNPTGLDSKGERAAPNTDGIDPDSCQDVLIEDSVIHAGDDAVAIKSGIDNPGILYGMPTRNVTVRNVTAVSPCCAGVCIGSETSGGISDIFVSNVTVLAASNAFYIKSAAGRGSYVRNVLFSGDLLVGNGVKTAMTLSDHYGGSCGEPFCNSSALPNITGITFSGISAVPGQQPESAGNFDGLVGDDFTHVTVENIDLDPTGNAWECSNMDPGTFHVHNVVPSGLTDACK